ncbi:MAG: hypothetical protein WCQ53_06605 [bacterium]
MTRLLTLISVGLFTSMLYSGVEQINNWDDLTKTQQANATELVSSIYSKNADVLDEFKIAMDMTYYSNNLALKYDGKYPNNKKGTVIIGYVPLQFVEYYESELQKSYEKKGKTDSVPRLDVVLAIHYTESNFIPSAVGGTTDNPSYGMPQLTLSSATYLQKTDSKTYGQFFTVSGNKVVFGSTRKQIAFTIEFLPDQKDYTRKYETAAITKYNGSGDDAVAYASKVLSRARLYKKMRDGGKDIDRTKFVETYATKEVKDTINTQLDTKGYEPLNDGEFKEAIEKAILVYEYDGTPSDNITLPKIDNSEIKKAPEPIHLNFPPIPSDGCEYYVKLEEGRTLFSYFTNMKDMVYTICNEKNSQFSLYYNTKSGKKVLKSLYDIDLKNNKMQTDVKTGDVIYLPVDMVIKGDKQTVMNMSRICPQ